VVHLHFNLKDVLIFQAQNALKQAVNSSEADLLNEWNNIVKYYPLLVDLSKPSVKSFIREIKSKLEFSHK
jgi:hypothetical protein